MTTTAKRRRTGTTSSVRILVTVSLLCIAILSEALVAVSGRSALGIGHLLRMNNPDDSHNANNNNIEPVAGDFLSDGGYTTRFVNSQTGLDQGSCTSASTPCLTLEYVTSVCNPNDVVSLEGSFAPTKTITVVNGKPLSFIANGTTSVDCGPSKLSTAFMLQDTTVMSGFTIKNCGTANLTTTAVTVSASALDASPPNWNDFAAVVVNLGNTNQRTANFSNMVLQSNSKAMMVYSSRVFAEKTSFLFNGGSYQNQVMTAATGTSGSAIYASGSAITATQSLFANNVAQALVGRGGESTIGGMGGAVFGYDTQFYFTSAAFTSNQVVNGTGGAIYLQQAEVQMYRTYLNGNSAVDGSGGSIYGEGSTIWSVNATFNQNYATQTGHTTLPEVDGGAVYAFDCTVQLRNTTLTSNSVNGQTAYGGGFSFDECSTMLWGIDAQNNSVISKSGGGGGAIFANSGTTIVWNSSLNYNDAVGSASGGAIMLDTSTFVIYNSTIAFDLCGAAPPTGNTTLDCGGAAALIDSTFTATSVQFFNNTQVDIYCLRSSTELYDIDKNFAPSIDCDAQCDATLDQEIICSQ